MRSGERNRSALERFVERNRRARFGVGNRFAEADFAVARVDFVVERRNDRRRGVGGECDRFRRDAGAVGVRGDDAVRVGRVRFDGGRPFGFAVFERLNRRPGRRFAVDDELFDDVSGRGFDGAPFQRRGRGGRRRSDRRGQNGLDGRDVFGREGEEFARRVAGVVDRGNLELVGRSERERGRRPGRRIGGEAVGLRDDGAVGVEEVDDVAEFVVEVAPREVDRQRFGVENRRFQAFRRFRRGDRRELDFEPRGLTEIVDGAELEFVFGPVREVFRRKFRNVGVDDDGRPIRFGVGFVDVGRVAEFVTGFEIDVVPRKRRVIERRFVAVRRESRRRDGGDFRGFDRQFIRDGDGRARNVVMNADIVVACGKSRQRNRFGSGRGVRDSIGERGSVSIVKLEKRVLGAGDVFILDGDIMFVGSGTGRREFKIIVVGTGRGFKIEFERTDHTEVFRGFERVVFFVIVVVDLKGRRFESQRIGDGGGIRGRVLNENVIVAGGKTRERNDAIAVGSRCRRGGDAVCVLQRQL